MGETTKNNVRNNQLGWAFSPPGCAWWSLIESQGQSSEFPPATWVPPSASPRGQEIHSTFPSTWILHNCLQAWPRGRPRPGANTCATPSYGWVQTSPKMGCVSLEFSTGYTFGFLQEYLSAVTDLNQEVFPPMLRIALRIIWFLVGKEHHLVSNKNTLEKSHGDSHVVATTRIRVFPPRRRMRLPFLETRAPLSDPNSWSDVDPTANCTLFTTESRMNITNEHHEWTYIHLYQEIINKLSVCIIFLRILADPKAGHNVDSVGDWNKANLNSDGFNFLASTMFKHRV